MFKSSLVNHGLVVFSGFDCNWLLPPVIKLAEKKRPGSGPTSAKVLQNPAPRSCARDQLESPPVVFECGMHPMLKRDATYATLCVKLVAHIMDYSHNVS